MIETDRLRIKVINILSRLLLVPAEVLSAGISYLLLLGVF
jgi:hypothetical protein